MPVAKLKDININYDIVGKGEPLVMIMGLGSGKSDWIFQVPFFKKHYQVVTFDNRGVGKSDKPAGPYSTRIMADDTIGLMDYLGIQKAHILGVSMGGMIAQEIAINYPERIKKLVLSCTYACDEGNLSGFTPEWNQAADVYQQGKLSTTIPAMFNNIIPVMFNRRIYKLLFLSLKIVRGDAMKPLVIETFKAHRGACNTHQALDRISMIKCPTLVIAGTKDKLIKPSSSEIIAKRISGAKLVKLEGGSHTFMVEMRDRFNQEVLSFLMN